VLARGELGYERIGSGAFLPHMVHKAPGFEACPLSQPRQTARWRWSLA
jgi:hypothetical protein